MLLLLRALWNVSWLGGGCSPGARPQGPPASHLLHHPEDLRFKTSPAHSKHMTVHEEKKIWRRGGGKGREGRWGKGGVESLVQAGSCPILSSVFLHLCYCKSGFCFHTFLLIIFLPFPHPPFFHFSHISHKQIQRRGEERWKGEKRRRGKERRREEEEEEEKQTEGAGGVQRSGGHCWVNSMVGFGINSPV